MTPDSVSTVSAELIHSPTGFPLAGIKTGIVALGVLAFQDLQINKESKGYQIEYKTSAGPFSLNRSLDVIPYVLFFKFFSYRCKFRFNVFSILNQIKPFRIIFG